MMYVWVSVFGEGTPLVSDWISHVLRVVRLHRRQIFGPSWALVFSGSPLGSYAGVVKRVAGVGRGSRSSHTFSIVFTLRNGKESSQTFDITAKSANPKPAFCGIVVLR